MQPLRRLTAVLEAVAGPERYIFATADLRSALPDLPTPAFKVLLSRATTGGVLTRVCRGIYVFPKVPFTPGLVLPHAAARLRAGHLLYLSLESALSEYGVISQIPIDRLTLMTSGRRGVIDCGAWGSIEFTHTRRTAHACRGALNFDPERRLWIANAAFALADLRRVGRNLDLVDSTAVGET
jgi:hypothetical protein